MTRYYIRDASNGQLTANVFSRVSDMGFADSYLSYGEAQCEALKLRRFGVEAHVVNEAEAALSLARLREAV